MIKNTNIIRKEAAKKNFLLKIYQKKSIECIYRTCLN